jgi:endoglycosylceramidase
LSVHTRQRRSITIAIVLAVALLAALPVGARAQLPTTPRYRTDGLWILDGEGRHLVLRGVNVSGAEFTPTNKPLAWGPDEFVRLKALGFSVVRLPIAWANLEPTQGHYDAAAIKRARDIVRWAGDAGLKVVLDMHQWMWSPCFGGNGMPAWATSHCPVTPPTDPATGAALIELAATDFWRQPELQTAFADAWAAVATAVGNPPYLLGYDILNEPQPGAYPPEVFETQVLVPFFRAVGARLRAINPGALLFIEPSALRNVVKATSTFPMAIGLDNVVYEPHQYGVTSLNDAAGNTGDVAGPRQFELDLQADVAQARLMGAALWIGEWGYVNKDATITYQPERYIPDDLDAQDALLIGSAYWGDFGRDVWPFLPDIQAQLARITPIAVAGTPVTMSTGEHSMSLTWDATPGVTLIAIPGGLHPHVQVTTGHATWKVHGDTVRVRTPGNERVSITITA